MELMICTAYDNEVVFRSHRIRKRYSFLVGSGLPAGRWEVSRWIVSLVNWRSSVKAFR